MEKSTQIQIENLGDALVREYLYRKGLRETLICMDKESPRPAESITSRVSLARELSIEQLIKRNRAQEKPFRTMIELIVHNIQEGTSLWPKGKKLTHNKNTMGGEQKEKATLFRPADVNVTLENIFDLKYLETSYSKEMIPKPLEFKEPNAANPSKGRISRDRSSRDEEPTPQEEANPPLPEHCQSYQQQGRQPEDSLQNVLRAKEQVLLSSLSEANSDYNQHDNRHRLGCNKLKTPRLTALQDVVTRAPFHRGECMELVAHDNKPPSDDDTNLSELKNKLKNLESLSIQTESLDVVDNNNDSSRSNVDKPYCNVSAPTNDWFFQPRVVVHAVDDCSPKRELEGVKEEGPAKHVECCISKWGCGEGPRDAAKSPHEETPGDAEEADDVTPTVLGGGFAPVGLREAGVEPISESTATALKKIVLGSAATSFSPQWLYQGFTFNTNRRLKYGFVQTKGGCCGVLAPVQATLIKTLLYAGDACSCAEPLRPTSNEARTALVTALTEILWRAGGGDAAVLVVSSGVAAFSDPSYDGDGLTETLSVLTFTSRASLLAGVRDNLAQLTTPGAGGCLLMVYSALLSRGVDSVVSDMDEPTPLIGSGGQCPLELVNLLLTGCAVSNVHDNSVQVDSCVLRGVHARADVGFLSLFEHYNSCQVGSYLKTPRYPIWVVCSDEHFTVLFSCRKELVSDWRAEKRFNLFYYDTMAKQTDEIKLTIDTTGLEANPKEGKKMVPPLEHCIRTKWKGATVEWGGSKPLF